MKTELFDYVLPPDRIAQHPTQKRDSSKLLVLQREHHLEKTPASADIGSWGHHTFVDLPKFLVAGDCIVLNDAQVILGRLTGTKETGGRVTITLVRPLDKSDLTRWEALTKSSRPLKSGVAISIGDSLVVTPVARIVEGAAEGMWEVTLSLRDKSQSLRSVLDEVGSLPLPPYIKRPESKSTDIDRTRYQTVFASKWGAAAAPTAGLHFTDTVLDALRAKGVRIATITLDIGWGTFAPIRTDNIEDHILSSERYSIPDTTAQVIAQIRKDGGRVFAVGTTVTRTLEATATDEGEVMPGSGSSDLYIKPGFEFRVVDGLLTNFHMPRSSLLVLVAAFAGHEQVLAAYNEAIDKDYRFLSYGDAMLIMPER